ncbi:MULTISPECIES: SDR family NAD(P)-dependent oxidoreductase [unclassified Acidiplasma]|uniref:SDR family NAD(P)-dependent oxidoreductase n=1 Tax=unclassified Acidiplasma TaxID=2641301 RepID=UPI0005E62EAA|nr:MULTISPECIES: SDR family NAD(P)-dependent oxidoreductase [unclassified Acidiplasma]KJE48660.1 3-ketoacyl-ACP reductase [Acidiplasma sp. MBA-1]WMT55421.1 MAG: SDR family NAD(P)-dependent oxidoreductase [Acidiplasma sp.]
MYDIKNKVAIVTGSTRGIGKSIARKLGSEGALLVLNYRKRDDEANNALRELKSLGYEAMAVKADLSMEEDCRLLIDTTMDTFGKLDILVNNAGTGFYSPFKDINDKLIEKTLGTDFKSVLYCSLYASRAMERGVIINIASITGIIPYYGLSVYGSLKSAVINLTKSMALELAPDIRVNAIAPGLVNTNLGGSLLNVMGISWDTWINKYTLTKKATEPDEIAEAVIAEIKIDTMTGEVIKIDGGQALKSGDFKKESRI